MKISYNWLQSHFKEKLPAPKKLAELLTMHSQEVENIEEKDNDFIFDAKITPDRSYDYIDFLGVIRDIAAVLKIESDVALPEPKSREIIFVKENDFEKILGARIPEKEISDILNRLGMEISKKGEYFSVGAPSERSDLKIKEDIVEEVARIYGYDKVEEKVPEGLLVPPKRNDFLFFADIARKILTGLDYNEVYNYSFAPKGEFELENPASKDKKFLRTNLADGLSANFKENSKHFKNIKIFELGKIFPARPPASPELQRGEPDGQTRGERLALGAISNKVDFYEMKGVADALLFGLGIDDFYYKDHNNRVAEVYVNGEIIGHVDTNSFEFDFDKLARLADESVEYKPISKYPAVVRDIAVFVPLNEKVENVLDVIENTAGKLLIDTDLFDIYENEGKRSMAFHLIFQSPEKTLTDEEVNGVMEEIFAAIEANDDWEVRR